MESFNSTDGWYEGRPVASGSTPQNRSSARSSPPTKTSITRTGLSSQIQSSRHSGKSVLCPRSIPSTKRFIRSLRKSRSNHTARITSTRAFLHSQGRLLPSRTLSRSSGMGDGVDGPRRHRLCQNEVVADLKQRGPSVEQISRIGLDTSKHLFQFHGVNAAEKVVLRKKLRRKEMVAFFKALAPTVIGIEACGASHHWAR